MESTIKDESSDHNFYTRIPNIVLDIGLKPTQLAVYLALKRSAGDKGTCTKSLKRLASEANVDIKTFRTEKEYLSKVHPVLEKPLIRIELRNSEKGDRETDQITIIDIWPENFQNYYGGGTKNGRGVVPNLVGGVVPKTVPKEEPYKEEPFKKENPLPPKGESVSLLHFGDYIQLTQAAYDKLCLEYTKTFIDGLISEMNRYLPNKPGKKYYDNYEAKLIEWAEKRKSETKTFTKPKVDLYKLALDQQKVSREILNKFNLGKRNDKIRSHCCLVDFYEYHVLLRIYYGISGEPRQDIKIMYDSHGFAEQLENALRKEDFAKW